MMRFVFPCEAYEQRAIEYVREFHEYASHVNGSGGLDSFLSNSSYADWLVKVRADTDIANVQEGKVPAFTYFYVREDDDHIIGTINIRLALNDFLRTEGGHIGYGIRPTERRRGYATAMLREALNFLERIGLRDILITCDKDNPASADVIQKNGGILDAEFFSDNYQCIIQRYRILR